MSRRVREPRIQGLTKEKRELLCDNRYEDHALNKCDIPNCPYGCREADADDLPSVYLDSDDPWAGIIACIPIIFAIGIALWFYFHH